MTTTAVALSWAAVAVGLCVTVALLVLGSRRNILFYVAAYFFVFAFGPVLNKLTGGPVYFGTVTGRIGQAATGFALAMVGMLVAHLLVRQRSEFDGSRVREDPRRYPLVPLVLAALCGYIAFVLATSGLLAFSGSKLDRVAAAGDRHYDFLLVELFACSLYAVAVREKWGRRLYYANLGCYIVYCLATAERDFIFVLLSVILHAQLYRRTSSLTKNVLLGALLLYLGSYLFALRAGEQVDLPSILNQGSLLFVDTFVMEVVPHVRGFEYGGTYLAALTGALLFLPGGGSLMQWLVASYAPGSDSGYGFSLSAEAYLNFGTWGIPVLFFALTLVHRLLVNRSDRSPFWSSLSVLYLSAWMYALRGETATLVKTCVDGFVFFGVIHLLSTRTGQGADDARDRDRGTPVHADA